MVTIAWSIAGSDSSAGAGIQADLKTMSALGVYGCSAITALTAQNTLAVTALEPVSSNILKLQLEALSSDLSPNAIKVGMVCFPNLIEIVAETCKRFTAPIIYDPVLRSTTGDLLSAVECLDAIRSQLLPQTDLLTPNIAEAELLLGIRKHEPLSFSDQNQLDEYIERLASELLKFGCTSVIVKGGDRQGDFSQDFWTNGTEKAWFTNHRISTKNHHGTGCTFSSAIAAAAGLGYTIKDAIVIAKAFVSQGLRLAPQEVGSGSGPLAHLGWPDNHIDMPWVTRFACAGRTALRFPPETQMGFYPIFNRASWLKTMQPVGLKIAQLRIKDMAEDLLESEIAEAINLTRTTACNLYINDHWQLAIKHGAYGVHLGFEDVETADVTAILNAGLKLGLSTHNYFEAARALSFNPSYIAIGPIFPTETKIMTHAPQGIECLNRWKKLLDLPLVAIGGIELADADSILSTGVDGIAVVREISQALDPVERGQLWMSQFHNFILGHVK